MSVTKTNFARAPNDGRATALKTIREAYYKAVEGLMTRVNATEIKTRYGLTLRSPSSKLGVWIGSGISGKCSGRAWRASRLPRQELASY